MTRFSANLGFLWTDRPLPDAIYAAQSAGFDAVECHWPYDTPRPAIRRALDDTGLPMLGLNTRRGNVERGENGLTALPDRINESRAAIDEAIVYAVAIGAQKIHVMAGVADGERAQQTFIDNLRYACARGATHELTMLIEPLNPFDAPDYFLKSTSQAADIIQSVGAPPNLKLMFDCYHVARTEGDVIQRLDEVFPIIGHIQFASVPDRHAPDQGTLNYREVFDQVARLGWTEPLGAEYKPNGETGQSLGWLKTFRQPN